MKKYLVAALLGLIGALLLLGLGWLLVTKMVVMVLTLHDVIGLTLFVFLLLVFIGGYVWSKK